MAVVECPFTPKAYPKLADQEAKSPNHSFLTRCSDFVMTERGVNYVGSNVREARQANAAFRRRFLRPLFSAKSHIQILHIQRMILNKLPS